MPRFDDRCTCHIPLHCGLAHLTNLRHSTCLSILICIAKHVSEHLFRVFKSLCHFCVQQLFWCHIGGYGSNTQEQRLLKTVLVPSSFFIYICDSSLFHKCISSCQ